MRYEAHRSKENYYFSVPEQKSENFEFPLHFHKSFEMLFVDEGEMVLHINGIDFNVIAGESALILPGQFHSYRTPNNSLSRICIFSADFIPDAELYCRDVKMHYPVFKISDSDICQKLKNAENNIFLIKSYLYGIFDVYISGEPFDKFDSVEDSIIYEVVQYLDEHFTESITLNDLANRFGYNYRYMSGLLNRLFKTSFPNLIKQYRVEYACNLLKNSKKSITDIATACGFDTIRSFNRSFKELMGVTPKEYKAQNTYNQPYAFYKS